MLIIRSCLFIERINYFKVISLFKVFKGRPVQINTIGTIGIPMWINKFDWEDYKDKIAFGESEEMDKWFYLDKGIEIQGMYSEYDSFASEERVIFKIHYDIFTTYIEVICSLEGIEMSV